MDLDYKMTNIDQLKNETPVCLIVNENDELVPKEESRKLESALKGKALTKVIINNEKIRHAGAWYQDTKATEQVDKFLNQHFNNQAII
jgi:homoserine acetyltransferase